MRGTNGPLLPDRPRAIMSESRDPESPPELLPPIAPSPPVEALEVEADEPAAPTAPVGRWRWLRRLLTPRSRPLALFLRGASLLAVVGVCLASFLMQLVVALRTRALFDRVEFVNRNQITTPGRTQMLAWLALGMVGGGLAALGIFLRRRGRTAPSARAVRVLRSGRLLSPLLLPGLAWPLLTATEWEPLPRIAGVAFVAFLAELCTRAAASEVHAGRVGLARALARLGRRRVDVASSARRFFSPPTVIVLLGVAFYAVWMSYGTILQHRQFGTAAFDLGNYDTMFFNTLHGHPFRALSVIPTGKNWSMLSNHAELTLFALLPLYALRPGPETLLILQAVALASGAIPLYRFASRRLPPSAALVLTLAYLLYAPMHQSNFY
ncbi:MAG: hypothetical protein JWM82_973, partial [Myxococcales bacterium]|nr:hypothetical protein [Myxococcales bacterium]